MTPVGRAKQARLIARLLAPWGVGLRIVDMSDLDAVARALEASVRRQMAAALRGRAAA
jgi:hypothetical protein